jgi:acyl carrier protein
LAQGYLNQPALTAEKFIPHPFCERPGARLYDSGDLARYRRDGTIEFLGRADRQIKVRGFRVELGEIQEILTQHPAVKAAAVVVVNDGLSKQIVAYVVGNQPQAIDTSSLQSDLRQRLPAYMVPSTFVTIDDLPLTPNGKVDLAALPGPDISKREMARHSVEAPGGIEEILASIWADVLGTERVGLFDGFFDLGGHSLLATQVVSRIREVFGIELTLSALFKNPTVAGLAKEIAMTLRGDEIAEDSPIQPTNREIPQPLSFAQHRIWFMERLNPGSALYNVPIAYRIQGELNLEVLEQSINTIIKRHDILRTRFQNVDGELKQIVTDGVALKPEVVELGRLADADRESEMQRLASEEGRAPFDLGAGLLVRAKLVRLSEVEHVLVLTFHHIAIDGWSIPIFLAELHCCYEAYASEREPALAPLPLQYADYAVWQRERLQGPLLEQQLQYWREQLAAAPQELGLPTDHARPAVQSYRGATAQFEMEAELVRELKEWSSEQGVTLFMSLLAGFQLLLWRYSGEQEIVVGTPIANRSRVELEGLIGCFANTLVLRTEMLAGCSYRELVRRVREVCLGAYAHQEVPFERLVEELQPERKLSHTPLVQCVFSLEYGLRKELAMGETRWVPVNIETRTSKFDLFLQFHEEQDCLKGRLVYNADLFESATIHYMLRHLENLLKSALDKPDISASELEMFLDEERKLLEVNHSMDDLQGSFAGESDLVDICFDNLAMMKGN